MPYYTYILYSEKSDRYYIGSCENLEIRLGQHNSGRSKSTKSGVPWQLIHTEIFHTRSEATRRESEIKNKKSRSYIEKLI